MLTTIRYHEFAGKMAFQAVGDSFLDIETRRKKQRALMVQMVERKVRSRAQQLYESRGQTDGKDLQDWFQAESEVIQNSMVAPLYRRLRRASPDAKEREEEQSAEQPCESSV